MEKDQSYNDSSPYKMRVYAQAFVYQRRSTPKQEMQNTQFGVQVPVQNWYNEFECQQLAVNYNGIYIRENDFNKLWQELGHAVFKTMVDKGLII